MKRFLLSGQSFFPFILLVFTVAENLKGQGCGNLGIQLKADIPSSCTTMVMTMIHDAKDRPYLYVANKEAGLVIYNITNLSGPVQVASVPVSSLSGLQVMNLSQDGDYLYLAIGNSFTNPQQGGMAIVDVSNPASPSVTDTYLVPSSTSGAGIVKVEGNYAYLGAMGSGLVLLDITDKNDITFVSQFKPDINYPVKNPNPDLYNARGLEVRNSIVYLCFDAGGFRIINCSNKSQPIETGRYANPALYKTINLPRAYNNIVLDDTLVYIAVDYCGMEVLNIRDTSAIKLHGWWNPDNCPGNNWFTSPVHANEIHFDKQSSILFISTGKSDMMAVDVSDPSDPDSCTMYGGNGNNIGTWGAGLYKDQIYLSYICTLGIPFSSNWTGVKILTYNRKSAVEDQRKWPLTVFPNPADDVVTLRLGKFTEHARIQIYDAGGKCLEILEVKGADEYKIPVRDYPSGYYFVNVQTALFNAGANFSVAR